MNEIREKYSWEDLLKMKIGTIVDDWFEDGIRCLIMRSGGSLCAYLGIPLDHPLAGFGYDNIPVPAHGGFTFSGEGDGMRPKGLWWYGWDYAHSGDYCFYYDMPPLIDRLGREDKKWLPGMVKKDLQWNTIYEFKSLMELAESIAERTKEINSVKS